MPAKKAAAKKPKPVEGKLVSDELKKVMERKRLKAEAKKGSK
jgi:hypothetical protein